MGSKYRFVQSIFFVITLFLIQSCASTKSATNIHQAQIYLNGFDRTLDAAHQALNDTNMNILNESKISDNLYRIKFYRQRYKFDANPNAKKSVSFMTELTIKKLGKKRTQIKIEEDQQSDMVTGGVSDHPGKDFLKELNKLLTNELQAQKENAATK